MNRTDELIIIICIMLLSAIVIISIENVFGYSVIDEYLSFVECRIGNYI